MAVSYIDGAWASTTSTTVSITITLNVTPNDGDIILFALGFTEVTRNPVVTPPSGCTFLLDIPTGSTNTLRPLGWLYYKVWSTGDPTAYEWAISGAGGKIGIATVWRGAEPSYFEGTLVYDINTQSSSNTLTWDSLTVGAGDAVLWVGICDDNDMETYSYPSGGTNVNQLDIATPGNGCGMVAGYTVYPTAGTSDARTGTLYGAEENGTLSFLLQAKDPIRNGSVSMTHQHTVNADGINFREFVNGDVTASHPHTLSPTATIYGPFWIDSSATLYHGHILGTNPYLPRGGSGNEFDFTDEPINAIDTALSTDGYATLSWDIQFNAQASEDSYPTIELEVDQQWGFGDQQAEITQTWGYATDVTPVEFELDQEWSIPPISDWELGQNYAVEAGGGQQNLYEIELSQCYNVVRYTFAEELLELVNEFRALFSLRPVEGVWRSDIYPDIAHRHSQNEAKTETFAHDSTEFPEGWQTFLERTGHVLDGHSTTSENLALGIRNDETEASLTPQDWFIIWRNSPTHRANMLYPWDAKAHPMMAFGLTVGDYTVPAGVLNRYNAEYAVQVFFGYSPPGDSVMATFELDQLWAVDDTPMMVLNQQYTFDAYFKVRAWHQSSYALQLSAQHEAGYGCNVAAQHDAPVHYTTHGRHTAPYSISDPLAAQHEAGYQIFEYNFVRIQHEAGYTETVVAAHQASYQNMPSTVFGHEAPYEAMRIVSVYHEADYASMVIVRAGHSASFDDMVRVTAGHDALYGSMAVVTSSHEAQHDDMAVVSVAHSAEFDDMVAVKATHEAAFADAAAVRAAHEADYQNMVSLIRSHEADYGSNPYLFVTHTAEYGDMTPVAFAHEAVWDDVALVRRDHAAYYANMAQARKQHVVYYANMSEARKAHTAPFSLMSTPIRQHEARYSGTTTVRTQHSSLFDLAQLNFAKKTHTAFWTMLSDTITTTHDQAALLVNGESIPVGELLISSTEDDTLWQCRATLLHVSDYHKFVEGVQFSVTLGTDTFVFQYNSKEIRRGGPASVDITVEGLSPAMALQEPRTELINRSYDTPTLFQDMIEDILGQSVTWVDFPNWSIPAFRVAAEGAIPLDLARKLVEAAGGLLESDLDGTLSVRKKYVHTIPEYPNITPDQVYSDLEDNLSAQETFDPRDGYNLFRVTEADTAYADQIEFNMNEDSQTEGKLRAYPSPWRTSIIIRTTDGSGNVFLGNDAWLTRQETETIEFTDGAASLRYPAEVIDSVVWHSVSLGGIIHLPYTAVLTTGTTVNQGYGLADITYTVRYLEYDTAAVLGSTVQYVVEDIN